MPGTRFAGDGCRPGLAVQVQASPIIIEGQPSIHPCSPVRSACEKQILSLTTHYCRVEVTNGFRQGLGKLRVKFGRVLVPIGLVWADLEWDVGSTVLGAETR